MQPEGQIWPLSFVRVQVELMRSQAAAIESGDLSTAIGYGVKLSAAKSDWVNLVTRLKEGAWDETTAAEIRSSVEEMVKTQQRLMGMLEPERDRMSLAIQEVRQGRRMLNSYRLRRTKPRRSIELDG